MVGQELNKKLSNKGFTLIELLIAMIITLIVMLGLLKGILEYNKFSIRAKMKDRATEIARQFTAYIESLPYVTDGSEIPSILYVNNALWINVFCKECLKDNKNIVICNKNYINCSTDTSSFFETETDFYDIGSPDSSNPLNISSNLRLYPQEGSNICGCRGSNCPVSLPLCTYEGFSGKSIYVGVNMARLISDQGNEIGKAAAVIVWYFEPFTNRFQKITNLVIKGNSQQ